LLRFSTFYHPLLTIHHSKAKALDSNSSESKILALVLEFQSFSFGIGVQSFSFGIGVQSFSFGIGVQSFSFGIGVQSFRFGCHKLGDFQKRKYRDRCLSLSKATARICLRQAQATV